jgi:hypothetical protein
MYTSVNMMDYRKKSEIRWWLCCIIVPLGVVGVFIVWLGCRTSQQQAKTSRALVVADASSPRRAPLSAGADIRRPNSISISVEVQPIPIPEAVDFVPTFDEFSLAFDRNVAQKMVLQHGESERTARIELNTEGPHNYRVIANQREEMGPDTYSPGNPGHSTFEGTGSIVLHNNAKYLIVVGKGTSYKDRVSIREIN